MGFFLGCPSSCECKEFGENQHKKILVTGEDLLTVPRNLPFDTGAVYVKSNEFTISPFLLSVLINLVLVLWLISILTVLVSEVLIS